MTFSQWFFGGIDNPYKAGQWGPLHIGVMLTCIALILIFNLITRKSRNPERTKKIILFALVSCTAVFEIALRFMYFGRMIFIQHVQMTGNLVISTLLPKPWCQISSWVLVISVFVKKRFFYNFASLSALLCAIIFFIYPGVGFNNVYLLFENWYSICTHALLLTNSITMISLRIADFRYESLWKEAACFLVVFLYGLLQVFVLKIHSDPLYFMPGGDIQADILKISYEMYMIGYVAVLLLYINIAHILGDKQRVKSFIEKEKRKLNDIIHSGK